MLNFLKSFFNNKSIDDYIEQLKIISNDKGEYSNKKPLDDDIRIRVNKMLKFIQDIEYQTKMSKDSNLYYELAIAYNHYTSWYITGENRKEYLLKITSYLEKSIELSQNNIKAKELLGKLLISEKLIKDLNKGQMILNELKSKNELTSSLNPLLQQAEKQIKIDQNYNFCKFTDPSPAVFKEERIVFRALIKKYKNEKNIKELETTLKDLYTLSVLVTMCYGNSDCNSATSEIKYKQAILIIKKNCKRIGYTFSKNGYISNSSFLSSSDWKHFDFVFGKSKKNITIT
jgi:hypothetical protein